jgi:Rha family phage regulatory protein
MNIVPQDFVVASDAGVFTDSRTVAKHFKKQHKNVLRAYENIECSEDFNRLNFEPVEYLDAKGESRREVRMTKNGFMFLVMGFTGREAARIKEAFIRAFDCMAEFIRAQAMQAFDAFNKAYQQHLSDKRHVSESARDMRRWQDIKPQQLQALAQLHPQMRLALN